MQQFGRISTLTVSDDHPIFIDGVRSLLSRYSDLVLLGQAVCAQSSLDLVAQYRPNVAILDLSMPGDVFGAMAEMTRLSQATRLVVYTAHCSADTAIRALNAGATGFVLKSDPIDALLDAIRAKTRDDLVISKRFSEEVLGPTPLPMRRAFPDDFATLGRREKQIVAQLLLGNTNREIADSIGLTEQTVKHHMTRLMHKLKVRNRVEVVIAARRHQTLAMV